MTQTILLTGASGYIAKHIALRLLDAGYLLRASVRSPEKAAQVRATLARHVRQPQALDSQLSFVMLDLTADAGWAAALQGVDALIHTASPFPMAQPRDEAELIRPAVDGALRAVRAARDAGVMRVVMTSSTAAILGAELPPGRTMLDETMWTDTARPGVAAYTKSKTMAERGVWDFVTNEAPQMRVTMINPGFVLGAPLDDDFGTSVALIERLVRSKDPMLPRFGLPVVDIGDVAEAHLLALARPECAGQRYMLVNGFMWMTDMAQVVQQALPDRRIVTRQAPDLVVRALALFDKTVKGILPDLGRSHACDNSRARALLGHPLTDPRDSIAQTARFLVAQDRR